MSRGRENSLAKMRRCSPGFILIFLWALCGESLFLGKYFF